MAGSFSFMPAADARVITYTGVGEYPIGEGETVEMARERAKERAQRNALEQAGVEVESETKVIDHVFEHDEIITITHGILKVVGQPVFTPTVDGDGFMMKATLKAEIETDDIAKWLNRDWKERDTLVRQNNALQKANSEQERLIADLQKQLTAAKSEKEKENIRAEVKNADNSFLAVQKVKEGWQFFYKGDYPAALTSFNDAIKIDGENAEAYFGRGRVYSSYKLKNYQQAIADFTQAITIKRSYSDAYIFRAIAHDNLKNHQQAMNDYTQAIAVDPQNKIAYNNRGLLYGRLKNYQQALTDLNRVIELDPKGTSGYMNRAGIYMDMQNYRQAIDDYTQVIAIDPKQIFAYRGRTVCYRAIGEEAKAHADYVKGKSIEAEILKEIEQKKKG